MFELVAHRGYAYRFPENTLVALEGAVAAGARYVEVDVQMTADHVPVLFHDRDCLRLCSAAGTIAERSYATVSTLSASWPDHFGERFAGNPVATVADLAGFLARHPDVTAFVEVKREAVRAFGERCVVDAVSAVLAPVSAQTVLISFSLSVLKAGRAFWPRIGIVTRHYCQFQARGVGRLAPEYHFCDQRGLPEQGGLAHPGCELAVYEVDDVSVARALAARGVGLIETFVVAEMLSALRARGDE